MKIGLKKKTKIILFISLFFLANIVWGQEQIYLVDFESSGGYTTSITETSDGATNYFTSTFNNSIGSAVSLSNIQGSYFFGAQDIDDVVNGANNLTLTISDIDITDYSNLELRVYLAEDDDGSNQDWDADTYLHITYDIDNSGTYTNLLWVEAAGGTNTEPMIDTDFDGVGDGDAITSTFTQYTSSISSTGTDLDIVFEFNMLNAGDEDIAIDHIEIYGISSSSDPTISVSPSSLTGFTYLEGNGPSAEQSFSISGSNLTNDITVTPPTNWEISATSGGPYQTTAITLTQSGGTVNSQDIYTRMVSGLLNADSPFSGNIVCESSGATTKNVAVDGTVTVPSYILISEVADPGDVYQARFVELYNSGASTVDLSAETWYLSKQSNGGSWTDVALSGTIVAGGTYVIAYSTSDFNSAYGFDPDQANGGISGNGNDGYFLYSGGDHASGTLEDSYGVIDEDGTGEAWEYTDSRAVRDCSASPNATWTASEWTIASANVADMDPGVHCAASNDTDSDVDGPALASQPNVSTISSLVDTDGEEIRVFDFDIYDYGSGDGLPTHVTQITINAGVNNTANWATNIQGVKLSIDGGTSYVTIGTPTINSSSIVIPITSGNLDIADGDAETVSLFVYLNTSGVTDGEVFEFMIDGNSHGFTADASGSAFASTFTGTTPSPVSNPITIDVVATELRYVTQPSNTGLNSCMASDVAVEATDANGNRDLDFSSDIRLTSTGVLSTSPLVVTASSGIAIYSGANCVNHTAEGSGLTLNAERDGTLDWDITSDPFNIIDQCSSELFFSEYVEGSSNNKFLELYNATGSTVDLSNYEIRQYNNGSSSATYTLVLAGTINDGSTFVIENDSESLGVAADLSTSSSVMDFNGDDALELYNTNTNSTVDVIGQIGDDPGTEWGTGLTSTSDNTIRRKPDVTSGDNDGTNAFDPSIEWDGYDVDDVSDLGLHTINCSCDEPTTDASDIVFANITSASLDLSWTSGNGTNRIVVCRKGAAVSFSPSDNTTYSADPDYSIGSEVGTVGEGNKVIYNGNGNSMTVTGLEPGVTYYFEIFEYGCGVGSEDYYTSGTPAQGNETTLPENVDNFTLTCITNSTATLTWDLPEGSFDGILITVRENTLAPSDPSCEGSSLTSPNTDFSSASVYCGNSTDSRYVYNGTGTSVTITGLTSGADYVFKAFTYKGATWTSGTQIADIAIVNNVKGENTIPANQQVTVMWNNPTTCYDEILVVVHKGGSVSNSPSGDGSGYTADASEPFSGTDLGSGDYVVYKGILNNFDATGLTNLTEYCFKIFTRKGSDWSSGVEICETPADVTVFNPGEFVVVGFDSKVSGGSNDAIYLMNFVDIKEGTTFKWVNSRFETGAAADERTMHWGGSGDDPYQDPAYLELKWQVNGQGVIAAGSIISFETSGSNLTNVRINGTANSDLVLNTYQGSANVSGSEGDQMWLVQGDFSPYGTEGVDRYNLFDGKVLFGLTSIKPWVPITSAVSDEDTDSSTNDGRESRLHPDLECFNIDLSLGGDDYIYYKNGVDGSTPIHTGTKRELLLSIQTSGNWDGGIGTTNLDMTEEFIDPTASGTDLAIGRRFAFNAGNTDGTWIGGTVSYEKDWFTCKNWEGLTVPDSMMDVTIPTVSDNAPIIDHTSTKAAKYNYYASCNNLLLNDSLSLSSSNQDTIFIYGNLTMQGSAILNLDDGDATTEDGNVYLYGNYDNQVSGDVLKEGNGTINLVGSNEQTVNSYNSETFYNLGINNTSLPGVKILDDISISNVFAHTDGTLDLNSYDFTMSGEYNRTYGDFEGNSASNFTISGDGNLDPIYFIDDLSVNDFIMSRNSENANLMTSLTTSGQMNISNGGSVTFNVGNEYTIGTSLINTTGVDGLIIKSDASGTASLLQNSGSVDATCERYLEANRWHMLSIPLNNASTSQLNVVSWGDTNPNFYWYDESVADFWQGTVVYSPTGWTSESNSVLNNSKGYIHKSVEDRTYILQGGTLEDSDFDITLSYSDSGTGTETNTGTDWDEFEGWNLFVNPYACAIDWTQVWNSLDATEQSYIENGIYYLDNSDGSEKGRYKFYGSATMNDLGLTDDVSLDAGTQYIPANQAVFIKATPAGAGKTITIPKSARLHNSHGFWKKTDKTLADNTIKLSIAKDDYEDETIIRTVKGATFDHDYSIDAYKMYSWDATKPQILTRNSDNSKHFGVNSIPLISNHTVIPIVTYIGEAGEYSIKNIENAFVKTHVWLEDRVENRFVKFSNGGDIYTFYQNAQENNDRFYLHFNLNHKPTIDVNIPDQFINVGENYSYIISDNVFNDVDFEDNLTLKVTLEDGRELPKWLTFDSETKEFLGTPNEEQILNIKVTAADVFGESVSEDYKLTVKSATSISELTDATVSIYPNPASDVIYIELYDNIKSQISVVDITGQVVYSAYINSQKSEIDLSKFTKGVYFVEITSNGKNIVKKIVLE